MVPFVSFTYLEQAREISSRNLSFLNSSATFSASEPRDVTNDNMASSTPGAEESRRRRKRLRYEDDWKQKKRKLQKDKGESYRTYKGEERAEKQLVDLTCKCAYRCREKVNEVERERLFKDFYKLESTDVQNKYLYGLIRRKDVRRRTRAAKPRSHTISYHVRLRDGSHVQVCKVSFCAVHAIGKRRIENLVDKLTTGVLVASDQPLISRVSTKIGLMLFLKKLNRKSESISTHSLAERATTRVLTTGKGNI